jgi:hypothetical protein
MSNISKTFFESIHCTSGAHCKLCRGKNTGRDLRTSWAKKWGISEIDFECPKGYEWDFKPKYRPALHVAEDGTKTEIPFDQRYDAIKKESLEATSIGEEWETIKTTIKGTDLNIANHPENTPCWVRKQKLRVIGMYQVMRRKGCEGLRGHVTKWGNFSIHSATSNDAKTNIVQ